MINRILTYASMCVCTDSTYTIFFHSLPISLSGGGTDFLEVKVDKWECSFFDFSLKPSKYKPLKATTIICFLSNNQFYQILTYIINDFLLFFLNYVPTFDPTFFENNGENYAKWWEHIESVRVLNTISLEFYS